MMKIKEFDPKELEEEKERVRKFAQKYAEKAGFRLNPDKAMLELVIEGLARNKLFYGAQYCPCRPVSGDKEEDKKKICPCIWHKQEIAEDGHCKCMLFFATEGEDEAS